VLVITPTLISGLLPSLGLVSVMNVQPKILDGNVG